MICEVFKLLKSKGRLGFSPSDGRKGARYDSENPRHESEGAWGYAEVQGEWLGGFTRDAELYTKHGTSR
jgi:hypothetical protein